MGITLLGFDPDGARARALDRRMHAALRDSLAHLREVLRSRGVDDPCVRSIIGNLDGGEQMPPLGFALYYDYAEAVASREHEAALEISSQIHALPCLPPGPQVEADLFDAPHPIIERMNETDGEGGLRFAPITPDMRDSFASRIAAGFDLMRRELPDLHDEIRAIVRQIVLAQAPAGARLEFDGASHYQYWGLLLLNPNHHKTPLAVVEVLAHEAAHSLLFGLTIEEPLVFNPDAELYPSPLRTDPRPMDGIYHATFVSARMTWAMERLAASPHLSQADRDAAAKAAALDRKNFRDGLDVVRAHGRLSDTGRAILDTATSFMDRAAPAAQATV